MQRGGSFLVDFVGDLRSRLNKARNIAEWNIKRRARQGYFSAVSA
jgi:hypothetical protein